MLVAPLDPLAASIFSLITIASMLLSFVMLGSRWLKDYMYAFGIQSWLIALLSALVGYYGHYPELYLIAVLTVLFRGLLLPYLVLRILRRLHVGRELHLVLQPSTSLIVGAICVIFSLVLAFRISTAIGYPEKIVVLALTVMFTMKLVGFLILSIRHEAVSHILGLMLLENGIFLGSQILIPGMPMLIELVVLFDLLVAVACFGVLVRYLLARVGSTSSLELNRLIG
ncbi:MAG TPA: hydrogenase [Gammaproteobacteria bacterium]|nr:hydrogenase [Gammaproteobacteria bacterium]